MNAAVPERLSSSHLENLAFVVLSAQVDDPKLELYPDLDGDTRARLRFRLKQVARYDFPSSMSEDPSLLRGYMLCQCCRLAVALLHLDSRLPPSLVVMLARNNEVSFLGAIAGQLGGARRDVAIDSNLLAVILPAEIQDALAFPAWLSLEADRVRLVRWCDWSLIFSDDLPGPGVRLVVDVAAAAAAMWRWISGRRLMTDVARTRLLEEIESEGKRVFNGGRKASTQATRFPASCAPETVNSVSICYVAPAS